MIKIERNTNGDSRTAKCVPTMREFGFANRQHKKEVCGMMEEFSKILNEAGKRHDFTKDEEPYSSMFYRDLCNTIEGNMVFDKGEWAKNHYGMERHHLLRRVPEDVNLFDVLEMIADCVCAGLARSGMVRPLEINEDILRKAVDNTVELAKSMCEVESDETY